MKTTLLSLLLVLQGLSLKSQCASQVFFSEIHYDNIGADVNEGFEICAHPGIDLSTLKVLLYNGSNGEVYKEIVLSGNVVDSLPSFFWFSTSLQNGHDGLALVNSAGEVLQFISYEGSFMATDGAAAGLTAEDIAVEESSSTALDFSLQLTSPNFYDNRSWQLQEHSRAAANTDLNLHYYEEALSLSLNILSPQKLTLNSNFTLDSSLFLLENHSGFPVIDSINQIDSTLYHFYLGNALPIGQNFTLSISNLSSKDGKRLSCPYEQSFLYNPSKTGLCISEIHYNPPGDDDLEFIEIYNYSKDSLALGGLYIADAFTFHFPKITLAPLDLVVLARDSTALKEAGIKLDHIYQWESGSLLNSGERISILNTEGDTVFSVFYDNTGEWPKTPNNGGHSLSILEPSLPGDNAQHWYATQVPILIHDSLQSFINPGAFVPYQKPFLITNYKILSKKELLLIFNDKLDFASLDFKDNFSSQISVIRDFGDSLLLAWDNPFLNSTENKLVFRNLKGINNHFPLTDSIIFAYNSSYPRIVVSEIMYNPPEDGSDKFEFLELYNAGNSEAILSGLSFAEGITFTFPNCSLNPGEYLVLAKDTALFGPHVRGATLYEFSGSLGNSGEQLSLVNSEGKAIFDFKYDDGVKWPSEADGQGCSLELWNTKAEPQDAESWTYTKNFAFNKEGLNYYCTPGYAPYHPQGVVSLRQNEILLSENDSLRIGLQAKNLDAGVVVFLDVDLSQEEKDSLFPDYVFPIMLALDSTFIDTTISLHCDLENYYDHSFNLYISKKLNCRGALENTRVNILANTTGIAGSKTAKEQHLFWPNPSRTNIYRDKKQAQEAWHLMDMSGRLLLTWQQGESQLDISNLKEGIYLLKNINQGLIGRIYR